MPSAAAAPPTPLSAGASPLVIDGDSPSFKPRLSVVASVLLYSGYFLSVFVAFNILRLGSLETCIVPVDPAHQCSGSRSMAGGKDQGYESVQPDSVRISDLEEQEEEPWEDGSVPSSGEDEDYESAQTEPVRTSPLYLERWSPLFSSIVVLLFSISLMRVVSILTIKVAAQDSLIESLAKQAEEEEEGGEETQGGAVSPITPRRIQELSGGYAREVPETDSPVVEASSSTSSSGAVVVGRMSGSNQSIGSLDSALLSILKHDVRAPLKGCLGLLHQLLSSSLDPIQQDLAHTVQGCTRNIVHLLNNISDAWTLSSKGSLKIPKAPSLWGGASPSALGQPQLQQRGLKLDSTVFELRSVVDEVLAMHGSEACEKGVEIASLVMESVPSAVVGDPLRLRQILMNLIGLSVSTTERGHVFLSVRLAADETDLGELAKQIAEMGQPATQKSAKAAQNRDGPPPNGQGPSAPPNPPKVASVGPGMKERTDEGGGRHACEEEEKEGEGNKSKEDGDGGGEEEEDEEVEVSVQPKEGEGEEGEGERGTEGGDRPVANGVKEKENGKCSTMAAVPLERHSSDAMSDAASVSSVASEGTVTPGDSHAARTGRGQRQLSQGQSLTLSGVPAVDGSNSWQSICGVLREQEERFQRMMKNSDAVGKTDSSGAHHGLGSRVRLVFTLEDTGCGLPPAVVEHFDRPFDALPAELQAKFAGVPLNVALTRRLVEAMGGQLIVKTVEGTGTTTTFDLTLSHASKLPVGASNPGRVHHLGTGPLGDSLHPELAGSRAKLRGMRCLVVDGSPVRQQVTATYMARLGLRVDLSDSAPAAALALRHARNIPGTGLVNKKSRWDIVVVDADCDGPGSGIELGRMVQQLKELVEPWEKAPLLPKLVLVAQTTDEAMESDAGKHGFSCIMLKPLRASSMATALLQALGLNPSETTAMAQKRRQILLRLCLKGRKLLVVDHVFLTRKAVALELSRYAEVCLAVETGEEALGRLREDVEGQQEEYSLVLLNMHLADMSGPSFIERLRMLEAEEYKREQRRVGPTARQKRIPILGLVSEPAREAMASWKESDIDGLLTSPLEDAQLFNVITKLFREPEKA